MKNFLAFLILSCLCSNAIGQTVTPAVEKLFRAAGRDPMEFYQFDALIYKYCKHWCVDPVLYKGHCMQESAMIDGAQREENEFRVRYKAGLKRVVREWRAWNIKRYGFSLSMATLETQLVTSWGAGQLMGVKAWEEGWRGFSMAASSYGLANNDTSIYYATKLYRKNMKRYPGEPMKYIIAYNRGSYSKAGLPYYNLIMKWAALCTNDFKRFNY